MCLLFIIEFGITCGVPCLKGTFTAGVGEPIFTGFGFGLGTGNELWDGTFDGLTARSFKLFSMKWYKIIHYRLACINKMKILRKIINLNYLNPLSRTKCRAFFA